MSKPTLKYGVMPITDEPYFLVPAREMQEIILALETVIGRGWDFDEGHAIPLPKSVRDQIYTIIAKAKGE